jgi:hypothetical protein
MGHESIPPIEPIPEKGRGERPAQREQLAGSEQNVNNRNVVGENQFVDKSALRPNADKENAGPNGNWDLALAPARPPGRPPGRPAASERCLTSWAGPHGSSEASRLSGGGKRIATSTTSPRASIPHDAEESATASSREQPTPQRHGFDGTLDHVAQKRVAPSQAQGQDAPVRDPKRPRLQSEGGSFGLSKRSEHDHETIEPATASPVALHTCNLSGRSHNVSVAVSRIAHVAQASFTDMITSFDVSLNERDQQLLTSQAENEMLRAANATLETDNHGLHNRLQESERQLSERDQQLQASQAENSALLYRLQESEGQLSERDQQLLTSQAENRTLRAANATMATDKQALHDRAQELEGRLTASQAENDRHLAEIAGMLQSWRINE